MLIVTNLEIVNAIFAAKEPRPIKDVILELYPEATIDCNNRAHAPYDGYECSLTGKTFRAGEYLPFTEPDDNYRVMGVERKWPKAVDLNGNLHEWDGTRAQNLAVWAELFKQTNDRSAQLSNHVGELGTKIKFDGELVMVKGFPGYYGTTWIHILKANDDVIVYKGSKRLGNKGDNLTIAAKVKDHTVREGVKQTVIERPKVM